MLKESLNDMKISGVMPDKDSPLFQKFNKLLIEEGKKNSNYYTTGTLVIVGWGNGDHEAGKGYIPVSGSKVASNFTYQIMHDRQFRDELCKNL